MLDRKTTKRHFPKCNNSNLLEFVFEKDPNSYLRKNSIVIRGAIECDQLHMVENGWVSKLFSKLRVEVDSQVVTRNNNRYFVPLFCHSYSVYFSSDYFLIDWLYKTGNFNAGHVTSALMSEGYYDSYNFTAEKLNQNSSYLSNRRDAMVMNGDKCRWEFSFTPSIGFLGNPDELLTDCELKLSFDRADPYTSLFRLGDDAEEYDKPLELLDIYAVAEYVSSEDLREKFSTLDIQPFTYSYDDCDVLGLVAFL